MKHLPHFAICLFFPLFVFLFAPSALPSIVLDARSVALDGLGTLYTLAKIIAWALGAVLAFILRIAFALSIGALIYLAHGAIDKAFSKQSYTTHSSKIQSWACAFVATAITYFLVFQMHGLLIVVLLALIVFFFFCLHDLREEPKKQRLLFFMSTSFFALLILVFSLISRAHHFEKDVNAYTQHPPQHQQEIDTILMDKIRKSEEPELYSWMFAKAPVAQGLIVGGELILKAPDENNKFEIRCYKDGEKIEHNTKNGRLWNLLAARACQIQAPDL